MGWKMTTSASQNAENWETSVHQPAFGAQMCTSREQSALHRGAVIPVHSTAWRSDSRAFDRVLPHDAVIPVHSTSWRSDSSASKRLDHTFASLHRDMGGTVGQPTGSLAISMPNTHILTHIVAKHTYSLTYRRQTHISSHISSPNTHIHSHIVAKHIYPHTYHSHIVAKHTYSLTSPAMRLSTDWRSCYAS